MFKSLLKNIGQKFKKKFPFKYTLIPFFVAMLIVFSSSVFLFKDSRTARKEKLAYDIALVAKKSNNKQLTADFYPRENTDEIGELLQLIIDTNSYNRQNYYDYWGNSHKMRVVANGEGNFIYRFPDLENNPTMILENTFSFDYDDKQKYENCSLYLMNTSNVFSSTRTKHLFLNESDANYLVNNCPKYSGLSLSDMPGKTITMEYTEKGTVKEEEWTIANIVLANKLDDQLYKSLYTSYVIADYHVPLLPNCYSVAFDYSIGIVDNSKFIDHTLEKFINYEMRIDKRNLDEANNVFLKGIVNDFYKISQYKQFTTLSIVLYCLFSVTVCAGTCLFCYFLKTPTTSTMLVLSIVFFLVYLVFFTLSSVSSALKVLLCFNTLSILSIILLYLNSITGLLIAAILNDSKKDKGKLNG